MKNKCASRYVTTGLAVMVVSLAAGCATIDTASSRFPQLESNINAAKAADAEVYAPTPLKSAETKLAAAKSAVLSEDMVTANKLIDEAMVDADYARALAPTEKSKIEAMKLREAIQSVRDEIRQMPTVK